MTRASGVILEPGFISRIGSRGCLYTGFEIIIPAQGLREDIVHIIIASGDSGLGGLERHISRFKAREWIIWSRFFRVLIRSGFLVD